MNITNIDGKIKNLFTIIVQKQPDSNNEHNNRFHAYQYIFS